VLSNSSKVVVDQKSGSNLLYLPLDKLMQLGASTNAPADTNTKAVPEPNLPTPAPAEASPRSRDAFRNREREAR